MRQASADLDLELGRQELARQDYEELKGTISSEYETLVLRAPQLNTARARVEAAEANARRAELDLERTRIRAPFAAHILGREVNVGSQVAPGEALGRLVGIESYWAEVAVPVVEQVATVDPEGLEPGPYELVAVADYGDRQSEARLSLFLGADFEPTWADDIQPLYEAQCALCHGGAATTVLEAPEDWSARIDDILFNVRAGNMPLGGDPLSDLDVAVIEAWAAAGYP